MEVLPTSKAINKHFMPKIFKHDLKKYECSEDNMLRIRSIALYYGEKSIVKFVVKGLTGNCPEVW